jgi:hypothetical protein
MTITDIELPAYVPHRRNAPLVSLGALRGRWVLIAVHATPARADELRALGALRPRAAARDAAMLAASPETWLALRARLAGGAGVAEATVPVLADPARRVAGAFGLVAGAGLLDPDGAVHDVVRGRDAAAAARSALGGGAALRAA